MPEVKKIHLRGTLKTSGEVSGSNKMSNLLTIVSAIGILVGIFLVLLSIPIMQGLTISYLWEWFIAVPFALPSLSLFQCSAIVIAVMLVTKPNYKDLLEGKDMVVKVAKFLGTFYGIPLFALLIGWIFSFWV